MHRQTAGEAPSVNANECKITGILFIGVAVTRTWDACDCRWSIVRCVHGNIQEYHSDEVTLHEPFLNKLPTRSDGRQGFGADDEVSPPWREGRTENTACLK
jgi:hypothetical protein